MVIVRGYVLRDFAVAIAAKKIAPKASLGTLLQSAQFADCLWLVWQSLSILEGT
ncbi:MAG TPA: hypothetical protein VI431_12855 [Candidatus Acidoferrum sp.]